MKTKSFTLIELLVVIVIIGILAGVIIVSTSSSINKANFAKAQAFSNTVQQELLLNLVSEWTFDNSSNIGEDTWGNNDGTVSGAPTVKSNEECVFGNCLAFNTGTNDYVSILDKPEFGFVKEMSAFIWVKGSNIGYQGFLSQYSGGTMVQRSWMLHSIPEAPGKLRVVLSTNGSSDLKDYRTIANVLDNFWHLVGFIFDNGVLKLYIDGEDAEVTKNSDGVVSSLFNSSSNLCIGCYFWNNSAEGLFKGILDDARIYKEALTTSEVKQNYIAGLNSLLAKGSISKEEYDQRLNNLALDF